MGACCRFCNGEYSEGERPPVDDHELCPPCKYEWFKSVVTALVREEENCYKGDGVLCTCGKSEARYRRLLELCGMSGMCR